MIELLILIPSMVALLLAKAFFSGSELALVSSDKLKLRSRADQGDRGARAVLRLFRNPESILATTLIGTNVSTMTLAVLGTATMISILGPGGDLYATLLLTPIMLIFGEIVPKSVFQQRADVVAPAVARPLTALRVLLMPIVLAFSWVGRQIAQRLAPKGGVVASPFVVRRRLRLMLESAERIAEPLVLDRDRIQRAVLLSDMTIGEAMIPLARCTGASSTRSAGELLELSRGIGHRRIPIYEGNISNIVAIATWTIWDELSPGFESKALEELTIKPHFASSIQRLDELLPILLARTDHMAVVVDEFGSATGIVTVEDLMAILLGDVARTTRPGPTGWQQSSPIEKQEENELVIQANAPLVEIEELLDIGLPTREFHTVGGLLTSRLRRIPTLGDTIEEAGYRFTVIDASDRAPTRIRIEPVEVSAT
jgi:putative hemolysin